MKYTLTLKDPKDGSIRVGTIESKSADINAFKRQASKRLMILMKVRLGDDDVWINESDSNKILSINDDVRKSDYKTAVNSRLHLNFSKKKLAIILVTVCAIAITGLIILNAIPENISNQEKTDAKLTIYQDEKIKVINEGKGPMEILNNKISKKISTPILVEPSRIAVLNSNCTKESNGIKINLFVNVQKWGNAIPVLRVTLIDRNGVTLEQFESQEIFTTYPKEATYGQILGTSDFYVCNHFSDRMIRSRKEIFNIDQSGNFELTYEVRANVLDYVESVRVKFDEAW